MNRIIARAIPASLIALAVLLNPVVSSRGQSLTIYHNNFALFQEKHAIAAQGGEWWYWLRGLPESIDTGSLLLRPIGSPPAVRIIEQKVVRAMEAYDAYLYRLTGKAVDVYCEPAEKISGSLEAVTSSYLVMTGPSGSRSIIPRDRILRITMPAGEEKNPPENSIDAGWKLAGNAGGNFNGIISYLLSGVSWRADYIGILRGDTDRLELAPRATISNSTSSGFQTAEITLVAGDVRRSPGRPEPVPQPMFKALAAGTSPEAASDEMVRDETYEYYTYLINEPLSLESHSQVTRSLMKPSIVAIDREYIFDGARSGKRVEVRLTFVNDTKSGAGEPLPLGKISLYAENADERLTFLGEDQISGVPVGGKVVLSAGAAFDLTGERRQTAFNKLSRETVEETYEISLRNGSDTDVVITVIEYLRGDWSVIKNTTPFEKRDSNSIGFRIPVRRKAASSLSYTVRSS